MRAATVGVFPIVLTLWVFFFFFFLVFLQELQGIHHVDCGAALSCESVCAAQITFVIPEEAVIIKMIIKRD